MIFKIGNHNLDDFVAGMKVDINYLTSEYSGRNAAGNMTIDLVNQKYKLAVTFRSMTTTEAQTILSYISGYSNISITFKDPYTLTDKIITTYIGTPSIEYYRLNDNISRTKPFTISFIEL